MDSCRVIISFNIGGRIFQTTKSTIESRPDTLLSMLYRHNTTNEDIFIDRDPKLFRWILYYYRTGALVDYKVVGIPSELWEDEKNFYQVTPPPIEEEEEEKGEKRKPTVLDTELHLLEKAQKVAKQNEFAMDSQKLDRRTHYARIFGYMLDNINISQASTIFDFIGKAESRDNYTGSYGGPIAFNPPWLAYWFDSEFVPFCKALGYKVNKVFYTKGTTSRKYGFQPAKNTDEGKLHSHIQIKIKKN